MKSELFFDPTKPTEITTDVRIASLALHAALCLASVVCQIRDGRDEADAMAWGMGNLGAHIIALYPPGSGCIRGIVDYAKALGLELTPDMDPELRGRVN